MKTLMENDVEIRVECLPEYMPIKGNASAIDEDTDRETENEIQRQLEDGNVWAWCCVKVSAHWHGLEGADCLGGCFYKSQADFCAPGGYYDDMKARALEDLNAQVLDIVTAAA